jgi:vitamin B12 transporter
MHLVTGRQDGAPMPGYATARVFASWEAMKGFLLKLRLENALDRSYEEVRGYPALPRSAYAGVEWRF